MRTTFGRLTPILAALLVASLPTFARTAFGAGAVTGAIIASVDGNPVVLPDIQVTLTNPETSATAAMGKTDLSGRFGFPLVPAGAYRLCWSGMGWQPGCSTAPVTVGDATLHLSPVTIQPNPTGMAHGAVTLADGTPCQFFSTVFGINLTADVEAFDRDGRMLTGPVHANTAGQYVLPGLPATATRIRAMCDAAIVDGAIARSTSTDVRVDLRIANFRPEIHGFLPMLSGRPVRRVPPGAVVEVQAAVTDRNDDSVALTWMPAEGSGVAMKNSDGSASWMLPRRNGLHALYVLASDRKGGIRLGRLTLNVGTEGVFFSGRVTGGGGAALPGAMVSVNDATMATDERGVFSHFAAEDDNDHYVVTVRKFGYVPQSRIFDDGVGATSWRLMPAQIMTVDPSHNINIHEGRGRGGARLMIAADSLLDETGAPPRGPVNIALASLDPDKAPLPGNDGGMDAGGREVVLAQFGGVYVEVRDAAGHHYKLKPGARARVMIPVAQSRLLPGMRPPHTIDMWAYDPQGGNWQTQGSAQLTGLWYDYQIFGDLTLVIGSAVPRLAPGCLLVYGQVNQRSSGLAVRVTPAASPPLPPFAITGYYNLIIPLPANTPAKLDLVDDIGDVVGSAKFLDSFTLNPLPNNTAQPGHPLQSTKFPFPTYCSAQVSFTLSFPPWAGYPGPGQLLGYNVPPANDALAQSYYQAVDPQNKRTTLGDWWQQNGFDSNGVPINNANVNALATYLNTNELGVGSYVRCSQSPDHSTTGCYMTMYGNPDGHPGNADLAYYGAQDSASWTLAMERRAVETNPPTAPIMKFFAFNGPSASAPRVKGVDLDGLGSRNLPSVCASCHGAGYYFLADDLFDIAKPDDSPELVYPSLREFDRSTLRSPSAQDQSAALDTLNSIVRQGNPVYPGGIGSAIAELIDGWYLSNSFNPDFVPNGWMTGAADESFYRNVIAKSCRTCHVAFDTSIAWAAKATFENESNDFMHFLVCADNGRAMPNAAMTYMNFWLSDRPSMIKNFFNWPACPSAQ